MSLTCLKIPNSKITLLTLKPLPSATTRNPISKHSTHNKIMSFIARKLSPLAATAANPHTRTAFFSTTSTAATTEKLNRIADELLSLTKLERHDYSVLFRLKTGLNRYGPAISAGASADAGSGTAAEAPAAAAEKTVFDIKLEKFEAAAKIKIIKEVRTFTELGLKEAKDLVEKVPVVLKKGVTKDQASPILDKLKELGATVVLE